MEVSQIAETVGVVTSITLSAMSANLQRSMVASAEASNIFTLGGNRYTGTKVCPGSHKDIKRF